MILFPPLTDADLAFMERVATAECMEPDDLFRRAVTDLRRNRVTIARLTAEVERLRGSVAA